MTGSAEPKTGRTGVTEQEVLDFLLAHPDFLLCHDELFDVLLPPARWNGDKIVDFQRAFVERSRARMERVENRSEDLIHSTRMSMASWARTHDAVLAVIEVETVDEVVSVMTGVLPVVLDVDAVLPGFEETDEMKDHPVLAHPDVLTLPPGTVDAVMGQGRDFVMGEDVVPDAEVFAGFSELVRSLCLARLRVSADFPPGILALGSRDDLFFAKGTAADLFGFLVRVLELTIRKVRT